MALSVCSTDFLVIRFSRYRPTEMFYQFFIHKTCMKCGVTNDIGRTKKSGGLFLFLEFVEK